MQAGVASSRSLEEVAELEQALCFLIKSSSDITDAKAAKLHAQMHSAVPSHPPRPEAGATDPSHHPGHAERAAADGSRPGNMLSRDHAEHAEGDGLNSEGGEVGVSGPTVSASSELITPEVEKLLPRSAHRVSTVNRSPPPSQHVTALEAAGRFACET